MSTERQLAFGWRPSRPRRASCFFAAAWFALSAAIGLGAEAESGDSQPPVCCHQARSRLGMVVSVSEPASRIGRQILEGGGNAVDAAVATAFALAVSWPEAGNIGGGGFMLVHPGDGRPPICVDYRETAPQSATEQMFRWEESRTTLKMAGVPGTVRGLALAHQRYGHMPWKQLVSPAVLLASDGVAIDSHLADSLNDVSKQDLAWQQPTHAELKRIYGHPEGRDWRAGDCLRLPDLARTLEQIAEQGPDTFYEGRIAELLAAGMNAGGGWITDEDLRAYQAVIRTPVHGTYGEYDIYGAPPPSSGGVTLVQAMNILECFRLREHGRFSTLTLHLMAEAMRRAFRDRAVYLGDPDFVDLPEFLTAKDYATQLASDIREDRATPSEALAGDISLASESDSTTHFSVVDANGMAVANTYTLEARWGSRCIIPGTGFVLNNEMGDFNWVPGHTDRNGRIGTSPNRIAPRKRMLSSQCPTIVVRDGLPILVTGSPGGRTIINTVLCVLLNVLEYDMDLPRAVESPRMHHQWFPDRLNLERSADPRYGVARESLMSMGHDVKDQARQGSAHSIGFDRRSLEWWGVADYRRGGFAAGVRDDSDKP